MKKAPRKSDLPVKPCATCGRPMVWRARWSRCWEQVRHCSERCRRQRAKAPASPHPAPPH